MNNNLTLSQIFNKYLIKVDKDTKINIIKNGIYEKDIRNCKCLFIKSLINDLFLNRDIKSNVLEYKTGINNYYLFKENIYLSNDISVLDIGRYLYTNYSNIYSITNCFNTLINPFGSLSKCVIIELIENYFNKPLLSLSEKEEEEIENWGYTDKFYIPKIILNEYIHIFSQDIYAYYPWKNFKNKWNLKKGFIVDILNPSETSFITSKGEKVQFSEYSCKKDQWVIALDKDMLKYQLNSIKNWRLRTLSDQIYEIEKISIPKLEKKLETNRINLEKYLNDYVKEEDNINQIINDLWKNC